MEMPDPGLSVRYADTSSSRDPARASDEGLGLRLDVDPVRKDAGAKPGIGSILRLRQDRGIPAAENPSGAPLD